MQVDRSRTKIAEPEAPVLVKVENISKSFGRLKALDNLNFSIRKGEIVGFLGPNGAGKTTAMRIMAGFFPPTSGKVTIGEIDLFKHPQKAKRNIGYLPETVSLYDDMRVAEFLKFVSFVKGVSFASRRKDLDEKLEKCGLWNVRKRLIKHLSKGYKQRLGLAQALIGDPEVLILDEPTSGLDPKQIREIRLLIKELGREKTLILSTHILPEVSMVCDRVMIINEGKVVASGTAEELESGLQSSREIFLLAGDRHRKAEIVKLLEMIPNVEKVNVLEERADQFNVSLIVPKEIEIRPQITQLFVEEKIPLLEIRSSRLSLEDIFLKIVVNESHLETPVL